MKVKDLIQKLQNCDPNAEVTVSDYTGCSHEMLPVVKLVQCHKGKDPNTYPTRADSFTGFLDSEKKLKTNVVYLSR